MNRNKYLNPIFGDVISYLELLFGLTGPFERRNPNDLKNYLKLYEYCDVEIDEVKLVLFHCLEKELPHIKTLKKHMNRMRVSWNDNVHLVLVLSNISKYQRNLLLKERISFIVPQIRCMFPFRSSYQ